MNSIIKKIALAITFTGFIYGNIIAQDSTASGKSEATVGLSYYKKSNGNKMVVAVVKSKNDKGKFVPAVKAHIDFYIVKDKEEQLITKVTTDDKGEASAQLDQTLPLDEHHAFTVIAKIENDKLYEDVEEQITYNEANLVIKVNPTDTGRVATVTVTALDSAGKEAPVKDVEVAFYVQRMFGVMSPSDENKITTDENGEASFSYPKGLPGDTTGAYSVVARVEDNETFGNLETGANTSWGTTLAKIDDPFPRALWAPNAPIQLILTLSILFGGVWCTYFFIFYQLGKIKKETKKAKVKVKA